MKPGTQDHLRSLRSGLSPLLSHHTKSEFCIFSGLWMGSFEDSSMGIVEHLLLYNVALLGSILYANSLRNKPKISSEICFLWNIKRIIDSWESQGADSKLKSATGRILYSTFKTLHNIYIKLCKFGISIKFKNKTALKLKCYAYLNYSLIIS